MLTVHFTHEDIANAYMSPVARPEAEALYALGHLERSARQSRGAGRWVTHARAWVAARPSRHPVLQHALRISDDLMPLLLSRRAPDRGAAVPEGTRRALAALAEFRKACITPYETSIREILDETRHRYSNMVARLGLAETLERLQCNAKWEAGRLTVDYGPDREVFLDGQGLELVPSVFLSGPPQLHTRQLHTPRGRAVERTGVEHPGARPVNVMVFPVCSHGLATTALVKDAQRPTRPLPQLLGRTRAAVLERLTRPQSTSELSAALRISVTTASEHASVLRSSGLVSTTRNGSSVLHEVTPLGALMLNSPTEPARTWCRDCDERCAVGGEARELVA